MLARSSWMTFALRCASSTPRLACHAKHVVESCTSTLSCIACSFDTAHTSGPWQADTAEALHLLSLLVCIQLWWMYVNRGQALHLL